ncbi:hypothetical protein Sjap_011226 [Stephania japonica]|uniref:Uncharacterized protein n=1 Tax=Stephania japonica TaxID=461633 RepID=A0AAP0JB08_9MAGN
MGWGRRSLLVGLPLPSSGEDGAPLWGPIALSSGGSSEVIALALMGRSPCYPLLGRGGELKLPSIGPLIPLATGADCARGPPAAGPWATASPVRPPSRQRNGGEPPLSSPLHGSYGVGKEEPPSGAPTPSFGEDGAPLWCPTAHSSGSKAAALALMVPPPPP